MGFLNTPHKKNSALLTSMITLLLLLFFSLIGLSYFDPPISYGMEVNFGTASQGQGNTQPKFPPKQVEQQKAQPKTEAPEATPKVAAKQIPKVVMQKEASVPVAKKETKTALKAKVKESKTPPKEVQKEVKKVEPPKPTVSKSTKQVLSNLLKTPDKSGETRDGEGVDQSPGDKGKVEGNPYASSYYGTARITGKGSGFGLNGRSLQNQGSVTQECNQEGVVVVRIAVDKNGSVIAAEAGVKGTTNSHPCLLEPAKKTAFMHKWFSDSNAPSKQVGFVVVNFKLGE